MCTWRLCPAPSTAKVATGKAGDNEQEDEGAHVSWLRTGISRDAPLGRGRLGKDVAVTRTAVGLANAGGGPAKLTQVGGGGGRIPPPG